jgi:hypothetical protein
MSYQRVKYKLINKDTNTSIWLKYDPQNWDTSEKTLKRSTKTFGVYTELSKNLIFIKDGADFLKDAYDFKDIEANVELYEYRYHPKTSHPYLHSTGTFDFSEYSYSTPKKEVKVPFKSGGLNALIEAQIKEDFDIERLESINGDAIDDVVKKTVALTSRKIFLVSQWEATEENNAANLSVESNAGNTRNSTTSLPLNLVSQSQEQAQNTVSVFGGDELNGSAGMMFFFNADRQRTFKISLETSFDAFVQQYEHVQWAFYQVCLTTYQNGESLDVKNRIVLTNLNDRTEYPDQPFGDSWSGSLGQWTVPMSANYNGEITLDAGDSIAVELYLKSDMETSNTAGVRVFAQNVTGSLQIEEDSFFKDSQTQAILFKDIGEKLMQIITGDKNRFYSDFYNNSEFNKTALTTGFWIRNFYEKPLEISLDSFINTSNVIHNTTYSIEVKNGVETLVLENLEYFFQNTVAIDLPNQVTNLEYKAANEMCYSSLLFGYEEGGEYDEAMGLDEYNVRSGFTLPITRVDDSYEKQSKARADKYAQEFARRKPKEIYPTTDTAYDEDLHLLDLKESIGEALQERTWEDDFEQAPKNVYSPETATNLRLLPSQIEQRHQWFYGSCLFKQQDKKVRYSNGSGNKEITTKKQNEVERNEKDSINVSSLSKPRFIPLWAEFEHPIDYYVNEQLNGKTNVNGRDVPNVYFKVQFIDNEGKKKQGFLFEQKKQKADLGKFKLLIAV